MRLACLRVYMTKYDQNAHAPKSPIPVASSSTLSEHSRSLPRAVITINIRMYVRRYARMYQSKYPFNTCFGYLYLLKPSIWNVIYFTKPLHMCHWPAYRRPNLCTCVIGLPTDDRHALTFHSRGGCVVPRGLTSSVLRLAASAASAASAVAACAGADG